MAKCWPTPEVGHFKFEIMSSTFVPNHFINKKYINVALVSSALGTPPQEVLNKIDLNFLHTNV